MVNCYHREQEDIALKKWAVEYESYWKRHWMYIEAEDGNEAVKIVKSKVIGLNRICGVYHDDDEE